MTPIKSISLKIKVLLDVLAKKVMTSFLLPHKAPLIK